MATPAPAVVASRRLLLTGRVQGVGFRPFVYRLAHELQLAGFVRNLRGDVEVVLHGPAAMIERFAREVVTRAPPLARPVLAGQSNVDTAPLPASRSKPAAPRCSRRFPCRPTFSLRGLPGRNARYRRSPAPLCLHQLHPVRPALHADRSAAVRPAQHLDARFPLCPACRRNTRIRSTGASMPSRSRVRCAARICRSSPPRACLPGRATTLRWLRPWPRCARAKSWRSRASAATT